MQIALLQTFADQGVIAIENVRLFKSERKGKEALEEQTATSEILRVIASSPTDLQPVMDAVAENAARVCGAMDSGVFLLEEEQGSGVLRAVARRGCAGPSSDNRRTHPGHPRHGLADRW